MAEKNANWSGRVGFILASLGMAFGAGNIWRFPRVVAANNGGPFLIAFIVATIVWAVPLLMIEMVMGKTTRLGTIGAFKKFVGPRSTWMGAWTGFCCIFIMFYYSVVTGWAMRYLTFGVTGVIRKGIDSEALWRRFTGSPEQTILFHLIAIAIAAFIILGGVQKGLERANKIIVPSIVVLLAVLMVWGLTKPRAVMGLEYLFRPSLAGLLDPKVWLNAFTQAAWSVGAGWGLMLTYAVYMSEKDDIGANSFVIAIPFIFVIVFGWWVFQAVTWYPTSWWNPWKRLSPGTMVLQWSLLMITVIVLNRWFAGKVRPLHPLRPDAVKKEQVRP